jgi:hypothetical protein
VLAPDRGGGLTRLETLSLDRTQITDAGLIHVSRLLKLRGLILEGDQVTDAGLRHLKPMRQLAVLNLRDTQVGVVRALPRQLDVVVWTRVLDLGRDADHAERRPRDDLVGRRKDHGGVRLGVAVTIGHRHEDDLAVLIGHPTTLVRCPSPQGLDTGRSVDRAPRYAAPSSQSRP